MTTTQRNAISSPAQGLIIYSTSSTDEGLNYYNSGSQIGWHKVLSNTGSQSITGSLTVTAGITGSLFGTASYATTASYLNTLNQDLIFNGNLTLNGTASIAYLNVSYESASVIYSSGSNQLGDATNDTQTLIGRTIVSGSFEVTGSLAVSSSQNSYFVGGGNLGIGTTSPAYKLDVSGSTRVNDTLTVKRSTAGSLVEFRNQSDNLIVGAIQHGSSGGISVLGGSTYYNNGIVIGIGNIISFSTNGTGEKMRIDASGNVGIGTTSPNAKLNVSGSVTITGSLTVTQNITGSRLFLSSSNGTVSGSTLIVYGSGSFQPVFTVQGSQGELFSITDSLTGSLFSVNDISGLPILEVFSDNTTLIGNYQDPMLITTAKTVQTNSGSFVVYSLPTASYDTAFFEYSIRSGSNARAGTIMAIQSGSSVNFAETTTTDFGSTAAVSFTVIVTGSNMALTGSSTSGAWTTKCIVRGI
jgi:hypothetical protein